jgi:hypothetical protein
VQQQHATLGAVAQRGALEHVDQIHQRLLEAEDRIVPVVDRIVEELVANELLLVDDDLLGAEAEDHVVEPLVRIPRDLRIPGDDVEILGERSGPVLLLVFRQVLAAGDLGDQVRSGRHAVSLLTARCFRTRRMTRREVARWRTTTKEEGRRARSPWGRPPLAQGAMNLGVRQYRIVNVSWGWARPGTRSVIE